MNGAFHIGGIGLSTQQQALDVLANNITNINTQSFKRSAVRFSEIMAGQSERLSPASGLRKDPGVAGVRANVMFMIDQQGELQRTERPLDIAIDGDGFIELLGPRGQTMLWRGGSLKVGEDGTLMAENGLALKSMINIPLDMAELDITSDGYVLSRAAGSPDPVELGQIMMVRVQNSAGLTRLDGGLYRLGNDTDIMDAAPGEDGAGILVQGSIERSNVDLNTEMVEMMIVQRAYSANAQIVQAADQMMAIANSLRR